MCLKIYLDQGAESVKLSVCYCAAILAVSTIVRNLHYPKTTPSIELLLTIMRLTFYAKHFVPSVVLNFVNYKMQFSVNTYFYVPKFSQIGDIFV